MDTDYRVVDLRNVKRTLYLASLGLVHNRLYRTEPTNTRQPAAAIIMARYMRIATPLSPLSLLKHSQHSNPLSACHFWNFKSGSLPRLSFTTTTTAMSRCEHNAEDHPIEYNWIKGAENLEKYKSKGYHPIMIGDMLHDRYRIVDKLGFGGYSTVWLAQDRRQEKYVAVKVGIAKSNSLSQEMKCFQALSAPSVHPAGHNAIPSPLDEFEVHGPNGTHPCYTMVPARCNLREASFSCLFPLDVARALVGGLTMAISHMHSCGYVHGGLLPSFNNSGSSYLIYYCDRYPPPQYLGQASIQLQPSLPQTVL